MRIFAFGCSFTKYSWPTWADIIAKDLPGYKYYNYAGVGLGNYAIQCLMLEADVRHKFNDTDIILVCWSTWQREDRFVESRNGWQYGMGNVLRNNIDATFVENYWSMENDVITSATAIITCNRLFNITYQCSLVPMFLPSEKANDVSMQRDFPLATDIHKFYINNLPTDMDDWCNFKECGRPGRNIWFTTPETSFSGTMTDDPHADVTAQLLWVTSRVAPALSITISEETVRWCEHIQEKIVQFSNISKNRHEVFLRIGDDIPWDRGVDHEQFKYE